MTKKHKTLGDIKISLDRSYTESEKQVIEDYLFEVRQVIIKRCKHLREISNKRNISSEWYCELGGAIDELMEFFNITEEELKDETVR